MLRLNPHLRADFTNNRKKKKKKKKNKNQVGTNSNLRDDPTTLKALQLKNLTPIPIQQVKNFLFKTIDNQNVLRPFREMILPSECGPKNMLNVQRIPFKELEPLQRYLEKKCSECLSLHLRRKIRNWPNRRDC